MQKRILKSLLFVLVVLSLVACSAQQTAAPTEEPAPAEKPFRVAMVFPGPINDQSWNQSGYSGLTRIENELGAEVAFRENVPLTDVEEAMRTFASEGYDLVIGHGDQFSEASNVVAPEFPNVKFAVVNGMYTADNLASIALFDEQVTYLAGVVAAKISQSGKIGYIGGLEIPPVVRNGVGLEMGAKSVNPDIEVVTTYLGSFTDAAKGKEAALAMAEQGVDVIYYYVDQAMIGIHEAATEKNIKLIGCIFDQHDLLPDLIVTSAVQDTATAIFLTAKDARDGKFEGKQLLYGLDSGAIDLAPFYGMVPADVEQAVKQAKEDIISGKIVIERTEG